jgi:hypothetical protein
LKLDPEAFAQRQLDAYNARDLERFIAEYTEDVVAYRMPQAEPFLVGRGRAGGTLPEEPICTAGASC